MEATENAWRLVAEPHVSAKKAFWAMDVNMTVHEIELADLALHQVTIDNTEWFINLFLAACLLQLLVWHHLLACQLPDCESVVVRTMLCCGY